MTPLPPPESIPMHACAYCQRAPDGNEQPSAYRGAGIPAASIRSSRRGWRRGHSGRRTEMGPEPEPSPAKTTAGDGRTGNAEDSDGPDG
jgi:hypothetical protein